MNRSCFVVKDVQPAALRALNYSPRIERIRRAPRRRSVALRELLEEMGPAYGSVFIRIDCAPEHGIELLSQSDMFAAEPAGRIIRRDSMARPERHEIKRNQVLIAGAGTLGETELYGRALIADGRLAGKYVGPDSMTLVFKEPGSVQSLFAYAYLASPTGVAALRSTSYGTKLLRFREDLLGSLPIPLAEDKVVERVASHIRRCVEHRELYASELQAARSLLEDIPELRMARQMYARPKARTAIWKGPLPTLTAWTYASTGGALPYLQDCWRSRLGDILLEDGLFRGPRLARIECEAPYGVDFVSQRDAFLIRRIPRRVKHPGTSNKRLFIDAQTILLAAQGSDGEGNLFGRATLPHGELTDTIFSEHLMRVRVKPAFVALAYTYLSSDIGFRLIRSTAVGTAQRSMREDLMQQLPFPEITEALQKQIEAHITRAREARSTAEHSESEAIRIIEEEVLPAWLA